MKKFCIFVLLSLTVGAFALPPIAGKPNESWITGDTNRNPLYKWLQSADQMIKAGLMIGTGNVFYVDSGVVNEGDGSDWLNAVDTLDEAMALCTANNGDIVYVAQGHAEDISTATSCVIDVAGVTVIGCGSGTLRPTFTYTNLNGKILVSAANVSIYNIVCNSSVTGTLKAIDVAAAGIGTQIVGCEFGADELGTDEFLRSIMIASGAIKVLVKDCTFIQGAGDGVAAISAAGTDYTRIENCLAFGDYADACISITAESDHILVKGNILFNGTVGGNAGLNAQPCIEISATTTGIVADNYVVCNLATKAASIVAPDCYLFRNYYNEDEGGAATGGEIGLASADDQ